MIPIMKPTLPKYEVLEAGLREIFASGMITNGKYVRLFEQKASEYLGVPHTIGAPSCTIGLMVLLSTLKEGSEVIMPAYTFSATYEAARWNGLKAVLVDCDETCNVDVDLIEPAISERTSAILAVHMYGTPGRLEALERLAERHRLKLFFDAAHAFGAKYRGRCVGGFGDAEVFSLGPTKTMPVGEGGLITTRSPELAERIRLSCTHGHGPESLDCEVKGINGRLQEVNGLVGLHLLDELEGNVERRNEIARRYSERLAGVPGVSFPAVPGGVRSTYKDLSVFIEQEKFGMDRDALGARLRREGIATRRYFYPPVHHLTICRELYRDVKLPRTEWYSRNVISLPIYSHMPFEEATRVCDAVEAAHRDGSGTAG